MIHKEYVAELKEDSERKSVMLDKMMKRIVNLTKQLNKIKVIYKPQKKVSNSKADYGVKEYSGDQLQLHKDIMKLMKSQRYKDISADDCMLVFGRVYAVYVLSEVKRRQNNDYR